MMMIRSAVLATGLKLNNKNASKNSFPHLLQLDVLVLVLKRYQSLDIQDLRYTYLDLPLLQFQANPVTEFELLRIR